MNESNEKSEHRDESASGSKMNRFPQDVHGKLEMALHFKELGTALFKNCDYKKAIVNYGKAVAFTKGLPGSKRGLEGMGAMAANSSTIEPISEENDQKAIDLELISLTNIATCYLKLNEPRKALEFCEKALITSENAWKAMLRKSEALTMMRNYELAREILANALAVAPDAVSRTAIAAASEKLKAAEGAATKLFNQQQKKSMSKMFE